MKSLRWTQHNVARPYGGGHWPARGGRGFTRQACCFFIAGWLLLNAPPGARSQSEDTAEYPVKLAFLYNFTQFVEWPADAFQDASAPLAICIVGDDPFRADLERELRRRSVGSHPIDLKRVKSSDDLRACHMVFVTASEKKKAASIVASLKGSNTLTVGETKGFAESGGIINLTVEENRLQIEINIDVARQTRLAISSRLLNLAKIVQSASSPGGG